MANEATIKTRRGHPYDFTCADATALEKGTLLMNTDSRTVVASAGNDGVFAGILAREKIASDGRTQCAVFQDGIFDLTVAADSTCEPGDKMILSGANKIGRAADFGDQTATSPVHLSGMIVGTALEAGSASEVIEVDIGRKS